ncbi:MAG: hypothetical protein INQ03_21810 [Candidatus Heimdallarchaeota archaeon]|nr:hypothetical protein [Candidatus Heimdallarchaeota archaeon]
MTKEILSSITIHNTDFLEIFHKDFQTDVAPDPQKRWMVDNFLYGISNFTKEQFQNYLTRIEFEKVIFDFTFYDVFIITLVLEKPDEMNDVNSEILGNYIDIITSIIIGILRKTQLSVFTQESRDALARAISGYYKLIKNPMLNMSVGKNTLDTVNNQDNFSIEMAFVCQTDAIPILYRIYNEETDTDPVLISGMLSAINSFANVELNDRIQLIYLKEDKIFFRSTEKHLYLVVVKYHGDTQENNILPSSMMEKMDFILYNLSGTIEDLYEIYEDVSDEQLAEMMDEYITIAMNSDP